MYSMENYAWGLVAYVIGSALVSWYAIWILGYIRFRHLRNILCLLVCAVLFTPILPYSDQPYLAPAFVTLVFESMIHNDMEGPLRSLIPISFIYAVLICLYVIYSVYLSRRKADKKNTKRA